MPEGATNTGDDPSAGYDPEVRQPIADVLPGLEIHPIAPGAKWSSAYVLVKSIGVDGDVEWAYRTSAPPNREELLGALMIQVDVLRRELTLEWEDE